MTTIKPGTVQMFKDGPNKILKGWTGEKWIVLSNYNISDDEHSNIMNLWCKKYQQWSR